METLFGELSTTGFINAPVTKGLICSTMLSTGIFNMPSLLYLKDYQICEVTKMFWKDSWRVVVSRLAFFDFKDLFCGVILLYNFRIFERRYGSRKFSSFLLSTTVMSTLLEILTLIFFKNFGLNQYNDNILSIGFYGVIFSLFVPYCFDIPNDNLHSFFGLPISSKLMVYLTGSTLFTNNMNTIIASLCGIIAGGFYRLNFLFIRNWFKVPKLVANIFDLTLGWIFRSSPSNDNIIMGATLEIQRAQQMDALEQQLLQSSIERSQENFRQPGIGQGYAERLIGGENLFNRMQQDDPPGMNLNLMRRWQMRPNNPLDAAALEENANILVGLGFSRDRCLNALQSCNNDLQLATNFLLQEM